MKKLNHNSFLENIRIVSHLEFTIDEKDIIFRKIVWKNPIILDVKIDNKEIIKIKFIRVNFNKKNKTIFCQVINNNKFIGLIFIIRLINQLWNGNNPIFNMIPNEKIELLILIRFSETILLKTINIKIKLDPIVWGIKYLIEDRLEDLNFEVRII